MRKYSIKEEILDKLKNLLQGVNIHIVTDLSCIDVQKMIPPLFKVLKLISFEYIQITYVEKEKLPFAFSDEFYIVKVPIILIFDNNLNEVTRIIESSKIASIIEEKLLNLITQPINNQIKI